MIGRKFSHYEVTQHLGSGGMGEVYKATDLTLGRSVAMKFLPARFLNDAERSVRFQREARMLAALNHPNIAVLHGIEEAGGQCFLVMELVPGETLAERIARGPLTVQEACSVAAQITEGLEAAHQKGIVHRDLKPGNIKILPNGLVKVLDFGLAKVGSAAMDPSDSPTMMTASSPGVIVGTPAYMSPEQAKGLETERATDIWSFGCVLYEMLTGRPAFAGETATEVLAEILKSEPDWSRLPSGIPSQLRRLMQRCLQKEIRSRFHDIADVRIELEDFRTGSETTSVPSHAPSRWRERLAWGALIGIAAAMVFVLRPTPNLLDEMRVDIVTPTQADQSSLAISADGQEIAFTALTEEDETVLWVRSLNSDDSRPLRGTEGASLPFWSPKERSIGFFAQSKLKRIDLEDGKVQELADASPTPSGGTWNQDDVILFSPKLRGETLRLDVNSGAITTLLENGIAPKFFPDGRSFLFRRSESRQSRMFVGSLDGSAPYRLFDGNVALPASQTHILTAGRGGLIVQSFDPDARRLSGSPIIVTDTVSSSADGASAAVSVSQNRTLIYRTSSADGSGRRLAWFDRLGNEISKVGETGGFTPNITPGGRYIVVSRSVGAYPNIWLLETATGRFSQFTNSGGNQVSVISPDGSHVIFSSDRLGGVTLFKKPINAGKEELLLASSDGLVATDWSHDHLLIRSNNDKTGFDIKALAMRGNNAVGNPFPVLQTENSERDGQFSPDGKWIAYESDRSGTSEIYVLPFPGAGREYLISRGGGVQARWNPKGKELFYISLDGRLMSVPIQFAVDGSVVAGDPVALFRTKMGPVFWGVHTQQYLVSDDGQRFLISIVSDRAVSPIKVILNWNMPAN